MVGATALFGVAGVFAGIAVISAGAAAAQTPYPSETQLQVPGLIIAANPANGAALVQTTVSHGHGAIYPVPMGNRYVYTWQNLSTGASGTITDWSGERTEIVTGAGQIVVTASLPGVGGFQTPSIGTFYVAA
ncbi:hypothetical protein ACFXK0_20705 [Nocardia sp. NPDC059177]|uniref:hypothetical protein n=1 Tax=Nocardia sp. NPDC059177 TaxID=3346759 RepID=UPI0036B1B8C0